LPDIARNYGKKTGVETPRLKNIKEDTGLRCGGRGKSEISSAL